MAAYSLDLRKRVLRAWDSGLGADSVAAKYDVSRAWVHRLVQRRRETGCDRCAHGLSPRRFAFSRAPTARRSSTNPRTTLLAWFTFHGDLAAWRALSHEDRREHHEQFARAFEQYLGEGKAPTPELQPLFAVPRMSRRSSWMPSRPACRTPSSTAIATRWRPRPEQALARLQAKLMADLQREDGG